MPSALRVVDTALLGRLSDGSDRSRRVASVVSSATRWGIGWHIITAILAAQPGTRRRVGFAGSWAWATAQAVSAAAKLVINRRRPPLPAAGPAVTSASMPSAHTASAVAYSTAGLLQHRMGAALVVPAAGVAWSRIRTRRHFGSDVAVGVVIGGLIGTAVGLCVRHWMSSGHPQPSSPQSVAHRRPATPFNDAEG